MLSKFSRLLLPIGAMIVTRMVDYLIGDQIGMSGKVYDVFEIILWMLFLIFVMWSVFDFGSVVAEVIIASPKIDPRGIHASLIKTVSKLISFAIAVGILFHGLSELGVSLIPVLTGLGAGGLAVALAARPTLENLIGGLMIVIDRPYRIGQRIKVKGHDGVVEEIGMRSPKGGLKHLLELRKRVRKGDRCVMFYLIQRMDAVRFRPADDIDPAYGKALRRVVKAGVEILAYDVKIDLKRIRIRKQIPIVL